LAGGVAPQSKTHSNIVLPRLAIQPVPRKQHHSEFSDRLLYQSLQRAIAQGAGNDWTMILASRPNGMAGRVGINHTCFAELGLIMDAIIIDRYAATRYGRRYKICK
jgi:hypothetical protein